MKQKIKIHFSDFWFHVTEEEIRKSDLFRLLSKKYDLVLDENPDFLIYSCFGKEFLKKKCTRIFCTGENLRPDFTECDYAFSFDYPVTAKNYRLPLYRLYLSEYEMAKIKHIDNDDVMITNRKFCNFVYSNSSARERIDFFERLGQYKKIDSGGKTLNNIGYCVDNKIDFLSNYKFTLAFENASYPGYTTEKILHAFAAKTIPIYWGNPLVEKDFNPAAFINCHQYSSFDEVIKHIIEVDNDDELYRQYLNEPIFFNETENEYVNEDNIFGRFDEIFKQKNAAQAYKTSGIGKYYYYQFVKLFSRIRRKLYRVVKRMVCFQ